MNLIQVMMKLMLAFGGRNSTTREISAVLAVVTSLVSILMDELSVREKRATYGDTTPAPFHMGHWDDLTALAGRVLGPVEEIDLNTGQILSNGSNTLT